jgi:methionyl-tRNA synthetase
VRWWLLHEVPRVGDADFTVERLAERSDEDLANGLGNLVNRVVSMVHRYRDGRVPAGGAEPAGADRLLATCRRAPGLVDAALEVGDFRRATAAVWAIVEEANRYVEAARPWELARAERAGAPRERLDGALGVLLRACRVLGTSWRRSCRTRRPGWPRSAPRRPVASRDARPLFPRIGRPGPAPLQDRVGVP